jgi:hypothetical protein
MSKRALLLRLDPKEWPVWEDELRKKPNYEVWFKTGGRRGPEDVQPNIPVFVLGTSGLGLVAFGTTLSGVVLRPDPLWQQAGPNYQEEYRRPEKRFQVKISLKRVPLEKLKEHPATARLHLQRNTARWLNQDQYQALCALIQRWPR